MGNSSAPNFANRPESEFAVISPASEMHLWIYTMRVCVCFYTRKAGDRGWLASPAQSLRESDPDLAALTGIAYPESETRVQATHHLNLIFIFIYLPRLSDFTQTFPLRPKFKPQPNICHLM